MKAVCGANCNVCDLLKNKKCMGCIKTNACPFGKKCWIAKYIEVGGKDSFNKQKELLINEFNSLDIDGLPKISELYPLLGSYVNLEYTLPNKLKVRLLHDEEQYLGTQVKSIFDDNKYFGLVANMTFILVSTYDKEGNNSELILFKKL